MTSPLLQVEDLIVTFPPPSPESPAIQAVRGVSFTLERGEILGVVGESGCGKSVALSAIPGLLSKTAVVTGSIRMDGAELLGLGEGLREWRGRKIGMIFQEPGRSYDPLQRIGSVFFEAFRAFEPEISREESDSRAVKLLAETGITGAEKRLSGFPHQFSGGQLQRIGIALALAQNCSLLIADEPTTALDVTIQAQIVTLLKEIRDRRGVAVIFISHNIDVVSSIADRILVLYAGLIMEAGSAERILEHPAHPYTRALLDAAPQFGRHYSENRLVSIPGKVPDPRFPAAGCPFAPRCPLGSTCAAKDALPPLTGENGHVSRRCPSGTCTELRPEAPEPRC